MYVQYFLVFREYLFLEVKRSIASLVLVRQESSHRIVPTASYQDSVYQAVISGVV